MSGMELSDDLEKLGRPAQAKAAQGRLTKLVQGSENAAAQVLFRLRGKLSAEGKALRQSCLDIFGIPKQLETAKPWLDVLEAAEKLSNEDKDEEAGSLRRYVLALQPDELKPNMEWAYHLDFCAHAPERALEQIEATVKRFPTCAEANQFAGLLLLRRFQQFERALPFLQAAVDLNPLEGACWSMLAWAYAGLGRTKDCVRAAEEALARDHEGTCEGEGDDVRVLAHFCLYLLGAEGDRAAQLTALAACVKRGETTPSFGLASLVTNRVRKAHSEADWLEPLAEVLDGQAKKGRLKEWAAFQRAEKGVSKLPKQRRSSIDADDAYGVELSHPPVGHRVPRLLHEVGSFLRQREHGKLGYFDGMEATSLAGWRLADGERVAREAFGFLTLGEGSQLVLVQTGATTPPAVGFLGSEGDSRSIANSLEEFLLLWSKGETTVSDLDEDEHKAGRAALGKWLAAKGVKAPSVPDFDFNAWLETGRGTTDSKPKAAAERPSRAPTAHFSKLGPKAQQAAAVVGLPADAPELVRFVTETLGKKPPASTRQDDAHVTAPKLGINLLFSHTVQADDYPPIPKAGKSFVPYLTLVWLDRKLGEKVLGVPWDCDSDEQLRTLLGPPTNIPAGKTRPAGSELPRWDFELDSAAGTELRIMMDGSNVSITLGVREARELEQFTNVSTALFVAYAATHGLLDPARFSRHAALFQRVTERKAQASELVAQALSRGLWDDHLRDDPELRAVAYSWFHNMDKLWITRDLIGVFGKREGPYGHDEPVVDDDSWSAVDKAAKVFDKRFAAWI